MGCHGRDSTRSSYDWLAAAFDPLLPPPVPPLEPLPPLVPLPPLELLPPLVLLPPLELLELPELVDASLELVLELPLSPPELAEPIYYLAGPPAMVASLRQIVERSGVDSDDIRSEDFFGY